MLYAILCYHDENLVWSWSKEEDAALMDKIGGVRTKLTREGKLPVVRLGRYYRYRHDAVEQFEQNGGVGAGAGEGR